MITAPTPTRVALLALLAGAVLSPARAQEHSLSGTIRPLAIPSRYVTPRTVQVYLPPGYAEAKTRRYPVLYLQDGQNVFDGATAFIKGKEWQADETAERLIKAGEIEPLILVAVPNAGAERVTEYTATADPKHGGGGADKYERFLIEELKPLVDRTFRTRPDPDDTGIAGSSLGALVALDAGLRHPDTFRKVAALSPAVWWADRAVLTQITLLAKRPPLRVWVDVGTKEPGQTAPNARLLRDALLKAGWTNGKDFAYREGDGDQHNEEAWAKRFPDALRFLYGTGR